MYSSIQLDSLLKKVSQLIISRYLSREIANNLFAAATVLMLAVLSQQIVRYLNYAAIGKIPSNIIFELVLFEIPYLLALLLPLCLYLGIMLAYGRLYADNEMSILQMCGFGKRRILQVTLSMILITMSVVMLLMLCINPWISAKRQQVMSSDEATLHLIQTLIPGHFRASADGRHVMYVEKLSRNHQQAENIFVAQAKKNVNHPDQYLWSLVLANNGYQTKDKESNDQLFVATDGYRYEGTPGENDYKIIQFAKYYEHIPQNAVQVTHQQNETLSTIALWQSVANPKKAAELQWRISIALSVLLLGLLAVPLSTVRSRYGRYMMLLPAILIYMTYFELLILARYWVERKVVPVGIGMWWVHAVVLLLVMITFIPKRLERYKL